METGIAGNLPAKGRGHPEGVALWAGRPRRLDSDDGELGVRTDTDASSGALKGRDIPAQGEALGLQRLRYPEP